MCNLTIIPLRKEPFDQSEMVNQILHGETFKIIKNNKKWSKVSLLHDSYEGWICNKQFIEISNEEIHQLNSTKTVFSSETIYSCSTKYILLGSILPSFETEKFNINNTNYIFKGKTTIGYKRKEKIVENAKLLLNPPYLWGGRSILGIDCSGFTQLIYRMNGINIPRDAYQQAEIGKNICLNESNKGDLAFFEKENKITHVGIIINKNEIIHASGHVRIDKIDKNGIFDKKNQEYTHNLKLIKKIF